MRASAFNWTPYLESMVGTLPDKVLANHLGVNFWVVREKRLSLGLPSLKLDTFVQRFWSKVIKSDSCWIWVACRDDRGYGRIAHKGKNKSAHRMSWEMHKGDIADGLCVCHHCDNPICVNPDHLFLGTHTDNMQDMSIKKRSPNSKKTHCIRGHEFTVDNTKWNGSHRACRKCLVQNTTKWKRKRKCKISQH